MWLPHLCPPCCGASAPHGDGDGGVGVGVALLSYKERDGGKGGMGAGSGCCVVLSPRALPHTKVLYLE